MNSAWSEANINRLGLLRGLSGSFWTVIASIRIPSVCMACMYFTKYFAYAPENLGSRRPPTVSWLVFIQLGGDQGEARIFRSGLMDRIWLRNGLTSARSACKLKRGSSGSVW